MRGPQRTINRDPNVMDTSATAQVSKATTKAEKERYRQEGRCFECGKQGHIVRLCPAKKNATSARSASVIITESPETPEPLNYERIGKALLGFSDDEKQNFMKFMKEQGEEMGFGTT